MFGGAPDRHSAELFALVVFVSDGYFALKKDKTPKSRFLAMVTQLPMEVQMLVCNRLFRSSRLFVTAANTELAMKALVRVNFLFFCFLFSSHSPFPPPFSFFFFFLETESLLK